MQGPWDGTIPQDYYAYAQGRESGGDDSATNPLSSATGRFQFTDGTWNDVMRKHPDLGLTAGGRTDADQSTRAMQAFTQDNAQALSSAGVPINSHSLYLAHRFGVGGALKVLGANPSAPVGSVLPNVISANPDLRGKTVSDIIGGQAMPYASDDSGTGALSTNQTAGPGVLAAGTRPATASGGLENGLQGLFAGLASINSPQQAQVIAGMRKGTDQFTTTVAPDGTLLRVNNRTGEVQKLPGNYGADSSSKWGIVGMSPPDKYTGKSTPIYGYPPSPDDYNKTHGANAPAPAAASAVDTAPPPTGQAYLDQLTKDKGATYASQVQAIIEGRAPYPTGSLMKTQQGMQLAQDVTQADPSFETGNATSRVALRNKFNGGTIGDQITAGNTAIQHAKEMSDAIEGMKGSNGENDHSGIPFASYYMNAAHNAALPGRGTPESNSYNDFLTARNHYAEEVTKFYSGSSGSEAEKKRALDNLDAAKSLPELRSAIQEEAKLMSSKVNALQSRWRDGMDPLGKRLVKDFPLLKPESQSALAAIAKRNAATSGAPAATPAAPQTMKTSQGVSWSLN